MFLGNNIYPSGMQPGDKKKNKLSKEILASQYVGFRKKGIPVYFIAGTAKWDNNVLQGYEKIKRLNEFVHSQNDSLLQIIPHDGCPVPYELKLPGIWL